MYITEDFAGFTDAYWEPPVMGSDLALALGRATANGKTYFSLNHHAPAETAYSLVLEPGCKHAPGEWLRHTGWQLLQPCETFAVLGCRPAGTWGYSFGVNEKQVAAGFSTWQGMIPGGGDDMSACDLVRLVLERSGSARQAVDRLTDLITRFGQRVLAPVGQIQDHIFLVADHKEGFVVEAVDRFWSLQEIRSVRAVGDVGLIRQDWNRIAPGLADVAIQRGWWEADGSKLDFAGCLSVDPVGAASALRRWGRATFLLENQTGHIDVSFLRQLLGDHYDGTRFEADPLLDLPGPVPLCRHDDVQTINSFYVELGDTPNTVLTAWCSFGPPCINVYFPIFVLDECFPLSLTESVSPFASEHLGQRCRQLQQVIGTDTKLWQALRERLATLQDTFDAEAEEFQQDAGKLEHGGEDYDLQRLAGSLMQRHQEQFSHVADEFLAEQPVPSAVV